MNRMNMRLGNLVLWVVALTVALGGHAHAMKDAEIAAVREGFEERSGHFFTSQKGRPFNPRKIDFNWNNRGHFTRLWGQDTVVFAMRAFRLDEFNAEANNALQELCTFHLDNLDTLHEIHSFPSFAIELVRLVRLYGPNGSGVAGRMTTETYDLILETVWTWARNRSKFSQAEFETSKTWHVEHSENHHLRHLLTCWSFSLLLKEHPEYRERIFDDAGTPGEHYDAFTAYFIEYLRERAAKGMFVEIASPSYAGASVSAVQDLYNFTGNPVLKQRASDFLTLYWALWAEEQLDAVRGGGKTRVYSGTGANDFIRRAAWYYLGIGDPRFRHSSMFSFLESDWEMPDLVIDLALNRAGEGAYEIRQRRMGLAEPTFHRPPHYRLRTDFGGILRYSYATPDFIVGSLMTQPLPTDAWTAISSQNRWHGVIFSGNPNARIFPQSRRGGAVHNEQWAVQSMGTLVTQQHLGNNGMRVWFSSDGLSAPREEAGWVFVESDGAYAGVRPVNGAFRWEEERQGRWLVCEDEWTPLIIEVVRRVDFSNLEAFIERATSASMDFKDQKLSYRSLYGDDIVFFANRDQPPEVNGNPIDYAPERVYDSPFVRSVWGSGVVGIRKGERRLVLDFNQ